ncbi:MAG: endonuclease III [Candidatus Omnitrophica bacterium]|nr:endonuclease III [Candidatus Omnitrophota bacterium]
MLTNQIITLIIKTLRKAEKDFPDPSVTLVGKRWHDPFLVWISCILSLRTQDATTLPAAERLFQLAKDPFSMAQLTVKQIEKAIYPVGFYHTKAKNILGICRRLIDEFKGKVPDDLDVLLSFNGVGRKTANLVLTEGFGKLGICVDTHVHRISNRLGYVKTKTPEETEFALREKLPSQYWIEYNTLLVVWGQNICKPVSPLCSQCPVNVWCKQAGVLKKR